MSVIVARSEKNQHTMELISAKLCLMRSAGSLGLTYLLFSDYTVTPSVYKKKKQSDGNVCTSVSLCA